MMGSAAITGAGVLCAIGSDLHDFDERLYAGDSGIAALTLDTAPVTVKSVGARVRSTKKLPALSTPRPDRVIDLGVVAATEALEFSGVLRRVVPDRLGIYVGCAAGGCASAEEGYKILYGDRSQQLRPTTLPSTMCSALAAELSIRLQILGPQFTYSIACASSAAAIGEAWRAIKAGYIDAALVGGTEAQLTPATMLAWRAIGVMAQTDQIVPESCRPFSADRAGMVLGEGAAFLVLESVEVARQARLDPLGFVSGYGFTSDAKSLTAPNMSGQVRAMSAALGEAGVEPEEVGYLNAHATGTKSGDVAEAASIRVVFNGHADSLPVSSTKSTHGHTLGAAGAIEGVASLLALMKRRAIPARFVRERDPLCDVHHSEGETFLPSQKAVISNSFAFGGVNASLVFTSEPRP